MEITLKQFLVNQPSFPHETETDGYYLGIARELLAKAGELGMERKWPEEALRRCALVITGYFQDVVVDAGIWRGFVSEMRRLYGRTLPFFEEEPGYVDSEFNPVDVRFLVWYTLAMLVEYRRDLSPLDDDVRRLAEEWGSLLASRYDDAPAPEDFHLTHDLEVNDPRDADSILRLGNWLYFHCWLLTPANSLTLSEIVAGLPEGEKGRLELKERLDKAMQELPTGPLALYLREWIWLTVEDRMPPQKRHAKEEDEEGLPSHHPYYDPFLAATGGERIAFFATYDELNEFFIKALGWQAGERHLSNLSSDRDFVLLVDPRKGMLLAKNVARCIAYPGNALYDKDYALRHAFELLTVRGRCPFDLLKFVCEGGWLPDARFPASPDDARLVSDNWDFIARCYLQQYYRGD